MKGTLSLQRLKRAVAVAGVTALVAGGAALLGTTQAHAALAKFGTGTGLTLAPATGGAGAESTTTPTFQSTACPSGDNGSATVNILDPTTHAGTPIQSINASSVSAVIAPANAAFSGAFQGTLANEIAGDNITAGVQFEIAVECFSDSLATQNGAYVNSTFGTINADGSFALNQSFVGPAQSVNLTLTANPNPATSGQTTTLTATASVAGATGTVTFENNGTSVGTAMLSGGSPDTAVLSTFTAPVETVTTNIPLTAVLTSPGTGFTAGTNGTLSLPVQPPPVNPTTASGSIPLAVTVPLSGTFTLTVNTTTWVVLGVNTAGTVATAPTTPIVVTDTYNSYPGWSVTGEATQWTGVTNPSAEVPTGYPAATDIPADHGSQRIAADQLGWAPTNTGTLPTGVTLGSPITAGTTGTGLGDAFQTLATGAPGIGSYTGTGGVTLGANLTLDIPSGQEEGPYAAFLNIDAMSGTP